MSHKTIKNKLEIFKLHKEGKNSREIARITKSSFSSVRNLLLDSNRILLCPKCDQGQEDKECINCDFHKSFVTQNNKLNVNPSIKNGKSGKKIFQKRQYIVNYLNTHCCVDCGNCDSRVLEFDHVRGDKIGNISIISRNKSSFEELIKEIEKCEIRCCNCHRIATLERLYKNQEK